MTAPPRVTLPGRAQGRYWDDIADAYQDQTRISTEDFHYGPCLPGDRELRLLPEDLQGLHCLELGCGAGQNSIALARRGARCLAVDVSARQLEHGRRLAAECGVSVEYALADMDALPPRWTGYHLIHSTYGLPFASDPARVVRDCANRLLPGGHLLLSVAHPLYAGEWWDVEGEQGMFLGDYFHPAPDVREGPDTASAQSRAFPLSETFAWLAAAGLIVDTFLEPRPAPPGSRAPSPPPYESDEWTRQIPEMRRFPVVAVFRAKKTGIDL